MDIHQHKILILDFGSQYSQLIARRIREIGVYCEILSHAVNPEMIKSFNAQGVILSGGPETVTAKATPRIPEEIFQLGCPVLGICYGMQAMVQQLGGAVEIADHSEFGHAQLVIQQQTHFTQGIEDEVDANGNALLNVWMSHGDRVSQLPEGFSLVASSENCPIAMIANLQSQYYGMQFHPEVTHTQQGKRLLQRFVTEICGCEANWQSSNIIENSIANIREQVGDSKVVLGLSGGVDSSVTAVLLNKAIGEQLTCVFVDTGLLRLNEADQVVTMFEQHLGLKLVHVKAEDEFLSKLSGITDPEQKRKIAGNLFIDIFDREAEKIQGVKFLAQGTIYPDVIESAASDSGHGHVIKSHHNVGGLPEDMTLELVEPLRELFKDEVREIGVELGLPYEMLYRHPFPGPGLAIRILGEVTKEAADIVRQADAIFIQELYDHDLYHKVSQAFVVFLPVKTVGVTGDARRYEYVLALRAVETVDFMTAHWAHLPYDFLGYVSNRIVNEVPGVARVVYDISGKPPATIEWE